ncbi:MAG TPA: aminotransferase class V-fold PLP-dependent enzyme [Bryobacteraceae bacterium]|nr:aminotransferase class V-fold PLP-dependent enzyme [Bryobacteraceae bacterium]
MADEESRVSAKKASDGATRRELFQIGNALVWPVLLGAPAANGATTGPLTPGPEIYQSIGVEPVINCRGTFTIIGASVETPETRAAMDYAARYFVQYDELAEGVGRRLAELTGAEWGMVSAGCAAGLKHVTAACVAGGNPEKLIRIPDLTGFDKTEVVIPRSSRSVYDHAVRNIGVKIIVVDTAEELADALSPRTAMVYLTAGGPTVSGPLSLENVVTLAKPRNIPVLVDAAAENLTIPNVHLQRGATVVAYSGGKAIRGPQCSGLLLGRKDILMSAWQASSPHHGPGRDNKVGREEMLGLLAAVEAWVKRDHDAEWKKWLSYLDTISKRVSAVDGIETSVREPAGLSNHSPTLVVSWDPAKLHVTGEEIAEELARTKPRIALGGGEGGGRNRREPDNGKTSISITAWMMQPGDDKIVADRIHEVLSIKRSPRPEPAAPETNLSGRWDVNVEFFSSKSQHALFLQQDGGRVNGSHKSDFSVRDVQGTIEGGQIKLRSNTAERGSGDSIPYIFAGTVSGDAFSGTLYMGEYLNAKFTATRRPYAAGSSAIVLPGGPPLAN